MLDKQTRGPRAPDRGWHGNPKRGASFGRSNTGHTAPEFARWTLQRVRLDAGGYDQGGAYWGVGSPLYWAACGDVDRYFRAASREDAKATVRREFPNARFHR